MASRPDAGLTILELLVSMALASMVMAALYSALIGFDRLYVDQSLKVEVEQGLRASFELVSRDLNSAGVRLIGNGLGGVEGVIFPEDLSAFPLSNEVAVNDTPVRPATLTVWKKPTTTPEANLDVTVANVADPITVSTVAGFTNDMVIWVIGGCAEPARSRVTISAISGLTISHTEALSCLHAAGAKVVRLEQIVYKIDTVANPYGGGSIDVLRRKKDEDAWTTVMENVTGITLTYFNSAQTQIMTGATTTSAERNSIRRIQISLTGKPVEKFRGFLTKDTVQFSTSVAPRNLAL